MIETYSATENEKRGDYLGYLRNVEEKHPGHMSDFQIFGYLTANL